MSKLKYTHNNQFFFNNTIITAYWCGFIAADGCLLKVKNKNSYRLQLRINKKDENHLLTFIKDIEYTGNLIKHSDTTVAIYLTLCKEEFNYLINNWNITPKKSLTLSPPTNLSFEQKLAFIKGYIDGDGSTKLTKYKKFNYQVLGTVNMLTWIKKVLNLHHSVRLKNNIYSLDVTGDLAYISGDLLKNSCDRGLDRKWSKLNSAIHVIP